MLGEFAFTCRDLLGWDETRTFSLLCGTSTTSTEPARALADVAALAGPPVRALLAQGAPADEVLAVDEAFAAVFAAYLGEYGCRALSYELAEPSLEERPDLVLGLVRDQLDSGFDPGTRGELARQRETVAAAAHETLGGADVLRFERALERALMAYPVREDNEFFTVSAPLGLLRRTALEVGRRLASRGQIPAVEDIFLLHPDEARILLADGTSARDVVVRRQREHAWALANPGPASYGHSPGVRVTALDLPAVLASTRRAVDAVDLGDRFEYLPADMFTCTLPMRRTTWCCLPTSATSSTGRRTVHCCSDCGPL